MAKLAGEKGRVLAFEPHPDIRGKLADNIGLNGFNNIKVFGSALSDKEGKTNLFPTAIGCWIKELPAYMN